MASLVPIGPGTRVTLKFSLSLASGELVDGTGEKPATFEVGDGSLLPGFERALFGLRPGDSRTLEIGPEQGFGLPNEENRQLLRRQDFDPEIELATGLMVSFANQQKQELPGVVSRFVGDLVEIDFNHPLAGQDLVFDVEILSVAQITADIIRV